MTVMLHCCESPGNSRAPPLDARLRHTYLRTMYVVADSMARTGENPLTFRAIFISDIHLGTRGCKADFLLDFLKYTESEKLYLVGDIIDGWRLRRGWHWPQA